MAAKKKVVKEELAYDPSKDFTGELIKSLNRDFGSRVAYNLSVDESPTHVKRWISTGSRWLDYIIANRRNGGLPEGRIIEISGPPSIGKSHIATQIAKSTQALGGIVVYIDTENATSVDNLYALGIDVKKRFVYIDTHCTEEVFKVAESTINKAKAMNKDIPVTIIWDSVAASSPKAELDGDYDKDTIGLQARVISKGMRKITGIIGDQSILFVCLNQIRTKIGVMFGDPMTTPGGQAIPFHSSVRLKLGAGAQIKNKQDEVIGIKVSAKTIKNKVAAPFREARFEIHFGKGIFESEDLFDFLKEVGPRTIDRKIITVGGGGSWKEFSVIDEVTGEELFAKKFYKADFCDLFNSPVSADFLNLLMDDVLIRKSDSNNTDDFSIDPESYEEMKALSNELELSELPE
jgi:recombination protein RecA